MEALKIILYIIATVVMAGTEILCPSISGDVSVFYVSILTSFLGLDIWDMIKKTSLLPPGDFKEMKIHRYVICAISYAVLVFIGYVASKKTGIDFTEMNRTFVAAVFILIGLLIGGLEGNKIATGTTSASSEE